MDRTNRVLEFPTTSTSIQGNSVELNIDPSIKDRTHLLCKESEKRDGRVIALEIDGIIDVGDGGIEILVKPTSTREVFGGKLHRQNTTDDHGRNNIDWAGHKDNNTTGKEGVISMGPFQIFSREVNTAFSFAISPGLLLAAGYSLVATFFNIPVFTQIDAFIYVAFFDWLIAMAPGVHPKENKRVSTSFSRFWQGAVSILLALGLYHVQLSAIQTGASGLGGYLSKHLFGLAMGTVYFIYGLRMISGFVKLFYGEKSTTKWNGFVEFLSLKTQSLAKKVFKI